MNIFLFIFVVIIVLILAICGTRLIPDELNPLRLILQIVSYVGAAYLIGHKGGLF